MDDELERIGKEAFVIRLM